MKKIPAIRFPEFSGEWIEKKLKEIGDTYSGLSNKNKEHFNKGNDLYIPFLNIMNNTVIDENYLKNVIIYPNENQNIVKKGDILFTTSSETPNEVGMCSVYLEDKKVYLNSFCFGFRLKTNINSLFLTYLLRHRRDVFYKIAQGATRYNLSKKHFNEIKLHLPPTLAEQEKIANFLSAIDEKIEIITKKIENLKLYKKGLLQKMLNVTDKGEPEVRFKEFSGKWVEKRLGNVATIKSGSSNVEDSISNALYVFFDRSEKVKRSNKYLFDKEAIIFAGEGSNFHPKYFKGKFDLHQRAYAIFDFINLFPKFLYYLFSFEKTNNYFKKVAVGTTVKSLRLPHFQKMIIHLPPTLAEQEKIANFLSSIDEKIEIEENKLKAVKEYKKGLLQKMFV